MLLVFQNTHLYHHQNQKMGGGQNLCFSKRLFFCGHFTPSLTELPVKTVSFPDHFHSKMIKHIFFYTSLFISFLFLKTTPTTNPKKGGGHTTPAYSFSTIGPHSCLAQKGEGGMFLKCPPPPTSHFLYSCGSVPAARVHYKQ